jgi:hypothetical protein
MSYYVTNENSFLDIKNAHLRVTGNVHTDVLKLGAIEVVAAPYQPTSSEVLGTTNFTNVTTGVTTSSNLIVGGVLSIGTVEVIATTHTLANTTAKGSVTPHTIEFSNVTTGLITTANVSVGKDLTVTGDMTAGYLYGDASNVTGITSNLHQIAENGNVTSNTLQFTNATTGLVTTGNVSVGNDLTVTGDMTAGYLYGDASNVTGITSNLHQIAEIGNVTSNTLQFTNATTGLVTTGNVSVGGELTVTGNVAVDTDTLFVDTGNDRVGVGTTTPQKTLEVAGPMRITDGLSNVCDLSIGLVVGDLNITGTKIQASDKQASDYFGTSVSMSSDGAKFIVGAYAEDTAGSGAGAAYIFAYNGSSWVQEAKIVASDGQGSDDFGYDVAMSGDGTKVIIGAKDEDTGGSNAGAAYIFVFSSGSWSQQQKIQSSDIQAGDYFGSSVAMSSDGTKVMVGAPENDWPGSNAGSAYIFAFSSGSWSQEAIILSSDLQAGDKFGGSVALNSDGTKVIVGAPYEDTVSSYAGSAYIFGLSNGSWSQEAKVQASDADGYDFFGDKVSMSGDGSRVIVGAFRGGQLAGDAGAAYIYKGISGSWSQEAKILPTDIQANDNFGMDVSMSLNGEKVVVGAYRESTGATWAGAAYTFNLDGSTWSQDDKLQAPDPEYADYFGYSVAMSGDGSKVLVGASNEDTGGTDAGAAYIFVAPYLTALYSSTPISAAGTTLSFTGQHMCVPEGPMSPGLVVSANKNRYVSLNGTLTTGVGAIRSSESLPVVSLSNVVSDRSVFGVVDRLEQGGTTERRQVVGATVVTAQKELGDTRVIVNSLGEGAIWVADTNGPLVSGDYMTTSNITGYAQKQDDDILHNYTVAKITMDCDFNPDDVPIQVIKKKDTGYNDLDVYGRIQWEDHPLKTTQKAYTIGYLTVDGNRTDEANAVHRTAFVGCTYHCG